jgi:REP element-mobilizing transposase RayT
MTYPPRICFDGAHYHVMVRGNNRMPIFVDDFDRRHWLHLLSRYKNRFRFRLHAYVLMPNHVHLVLQPATGTTISRVMQCLTVAYTKYFNTRHQRVGHVFQGRFRSRLIDTDNYLLVVSRYVHLNPVRAELVSRPADFPWSSYRAYLKSPEDPLRLVDPEDVLALVSRAASHQRAGYRAFVEMAADASLPDPRIFAEL